MEQRSALKMAESSMTLAADRVSALGGKLEDLFFRAQRLASAEKNGIKSNDSMFGADLQNFRRDIRNFKAEAESLPAMLSNIERTAVYDEESTKAAQSLARICARVSKALKALSDQAYLAHGHIRAADHKIEAWYLCQELEEMASKGQTIPTICNKLILKVSDPKETGATPNPPPAAPPPAH